MAIRYIDAQPGTSDLHALVGAVPFRYNTTTDKIVFLDDDGSTVRNLVTEDQTQTLTNKTLTTPTLTSAVLTAATVTTSLTPTSSDGAALGSATLMFSDLFLASGAVINFNNGNVTLTHTTGKLTFNGVLDLSTGTAGAATAALIAGAGTSATPCTTSTADKNFLGFWTQSTATTGDSRGLYLRHYLGAAGSGEALRVFATATAPDVATGGTANAVHASFSLSGASASISGQANVARLTLGADAQTRTINGNMSVATVESDLATGNTVPASVAFVRVVDLGAVRIGSLLRMPNISNGTIFAAHTTQGLTHSIKIVTDDGTAYYIMCTDAATNRS